MPEASANPVSPRVLVAAGLACALSVPVTMGAWADSTLAPTQRVLLSSDAPTSVLSEAVTAAGGQVVQTYEIAQSVLADLPEGVTAPQGSFAIPDMVMRFNSAPKAAVVSDDVNTFRQTIRAPEAADGSGVTVAVIDTGVDTDADITVSDSSVNVSDGPDGDGLGHGTFMAGLVAGDDDQFGGVAPGAEIMDVQVADEDGSTNLSKVLAGLQAVADQRAHDDSLQVAMLALSTDSPLPPWIDPLTRSLDQLWARGVTVVVAAGNDGAREVPSPASDPLLLVVGAQDEADTATIDDDTVADFSSYGRAFGEKRPDLVAPGVSLISTASKTSDAYKENPDSHVGDDFLKGTGTSMSAAVTAGAVAALVGETELTPDQAKRLLIGTANRTPALKVSKGGGAGALDLAAAMTTPLESVPPLSQETPDAGRFGPSEQDAQAWADFAEGWESGDLRAVAKAWVAMSPQTRKWAANAWSIAALMRALQADDDTFDGRRWAGRRWATEDWNGRRWATDEWVGRRWADEQWLSEVWDGRRWAGRRWAASDWLAFAWSLRETADDPELQDLWLDEQWEGRRWAGRRWAATDWVGRRWAADAWEGRRWADYTWNGRRWASGEWTGRRWADFSFDGRRWATEDWNGRRWATLGW